MHGNGSRCIPFNHSAQQGLAQSLHGLFEIFGQGSADTADVEDKCLRKFCNRTLESN